MSKEDFKTFSIDRYIQDNKLRGWDRTFGANSDWYKLTQLVTSGEFTDFIGEVMLEGMEEIIEYELVADKLFQNMNHSGGAGPISWLEEHGMDAQKLAEGETPQMARIRHAKKTFRSAKWGLGLEFTHEAIRDVNKMDTLGKHLKRVARAIAFKENQYLFATAFAGVANGTSRHLTGDVHSSHILNATDATWANSAGVITPQKMQVVQQIGQDEGFTYGTMAVNPATFTSMLTTDAFEASNVIQYLSPKATQLVEGEALRPYFLPNGMEIISNRAMPTGYAMFVDKNEFGGYFDVEGLSSVELPTSLARMKQMAFYKEAGAVAMKPGGAVLIKNLVSTDPADYVS